MAKTIVEHDSPTVFCKISIDNDEKWVHGIITYMNLPNNIVEVFLSIKYFENYLNEGSKILIKSLAEDSETLLSGRITKKVISIRKQSITVQIDNISHFDNNRKYERYHVNYSCSINTKKNMSSPATITDLSISGGLFFSREDFDINSIVDTNIYISSTLTLKFAALIIRKQKVKDNGFRYGFHINEIDQDSNSLLGELIEYLIIQKKHVVYEWKIFKRLKYTVYTISLLSIFILIFLILASKAL